jgi:hypothetical protein
MVSPQKPLSNVCSTRRRVYMAVCLRLKGIVPRSTEAMNAVR